MNPYQSAGRVKAFLFLFAIAIILGALIYTQSLVSRLRDDIREYLNFYADVYAETATDFQTTDSRFFFEKVIQRINFPVIISSQRDAHPTAWKNIGIPVDATGPESLSEITQRMHKMDEANEPIPMHFEEIVLGYIHYGDSRIIRELRSLPYIEIVVVALFILIGYMGYQTIRKSEQRLIWVGMARETAHQLGTPISSLLGWIALLRDKGLPEGTHHILDQMRNDIRRLEQITARFSQISSREELVDGELGEVIDDAVGYIRKRLPHTNKSVQIEVQGTTAVELPMNKELLEWALENLIKNGIDAIEKPNGTIRIEVATSNARTITIDVIDTGRGITGLTDKNNIFKPGYSTKKRGWGLGLSLTKRIVEEYHQGKLELVTTSPSEGTTMRITLDREKLSRLRSSATGTGGKSN